MEVCRLRMRYDLRNQDRIWNLHTSRENASKYPLDVLAYAYRHSYLDICDQVAPLTIGLPLADVRKKMLGGASAWV